MLLDIPPPYAVLQTALVTTGTSTVCKRMDPEPPSLVAPHPATRASVPAAVPAPWAGNPMVEIDGSARFKDEPSLITDMSLFKVIRLY